MLNFGENLRALRTEAGYSLDTLAKTYNEMFNGKLNKSTLSRYENGLQEPIITVVKNLAELFHVSSDYLLGNVSEPFFYLDNDRILHDINEDTDDSALDENYVILSRKAKNLTPEQRKQLLDVARVMFEEEFKD